MWVAAIPGTLSSLLTKPTLGSAVCELLPSMATLSSLLTKPAHGSAGSELLQSLALFQPCWPSSPLALQQVSYHCSWHPFKLADQAYPWLCRKWVVAVSGTLSSLLTKLTLGSAVGELLLSLAPLQTCWSSSPLALQRVSCCCSWHPFKPADQAHPWLCSLWVAAVSGILSSLLTKHTLGSAESELLLSLAPFQACWSSPLLALQEVSCFFLWHSFKFADQAHSWLCSLWVAAIFGTLSSLLTKPTLGPAVCELLLPLAPSQACWLSLHLALQGVSCCCPWHSFELVDQAPFWLCREWVAAVPGILSSLLTKPMLGSTDSKCLLSLGLFHICR